MPKKETTNTETEAIFLRKVDVVICNNDFEDTIVETPSVEPVEDTEQQEQELTDDTELR